MKKMFLVFLSVSLFLLGCSDDDSAQVSGKDSFTRVFTDYKGTCMPTSFPSFGSLDTSYVCTPGVSSTLTVSGVGSNYIVTYISALSEYYGEEGATSDGSSSSWYFSSSDHSLIITYDASAETVTLEFTFFTVSSDDSSSDSSNSSTEEATGE